MVNGSKGLFKLENQEKAFWRGSVLLRSDYYEASHEKSREEPRKSQSMGPEAEAGLE